MKQGKNLNQLAAELTRIQESKRDFTVPTSKLSMNDQGNIEFTNGSKHEFNLNNWSTGQVASHVDIPKQYFDRLRSQNPALLAKNVNHGFQQITKENPKDGRLVRTLDGHIRGFLSSRYRVLDAAELLEVALPVLIDKGFEVRSSEVTERRMYLKVTSPKMQAEVKVGDVVEYGCVISASDVGAGSTRAEAFTNRLWCMNGAVHETKFKQAHIGRNQFSEEIGELLTDRTKQLNDAAFFSTFRDYLQGVLSHDMFNKQIEKMKVAAGLKIENMDLEQVVEVSMYTTGIRGEGIKKSILHALATGNEGAGLTMWGLANSFTRAAQDDAIDYDTATDLERAGGAILELSPTAWKKIAA